ncbi:MAG: class I SAM-dependent methyltransferase [Betaproteobacteria bacterium]|nr:class I SAM-dependent methyltransferase [Betaproteobacteria bacterium]MBI2958809.1 class I SAM-dependent methyltransferase [Betaproteobacteria bacterium]
MVWPKLRPAFLPRAWLLLWLATAALAAPALGQILLGEEARFRDAQQWSRVFDDPLRDRWQKPAQVIRALELKPGSRVADIGSATGYFAVRLARAVPKGRVFGVDIEPEMVRFLAERGKKEGLGNLTSIAGAPDDPKLPEAVDVMVLVDAYHHLSDRVGYLSKLRRYLRPGGRVAIIDHIDTPGGTLRSKRIAPRRIKDELRRAGYVVWREHAFLPMQYFVIFKPAPRKRAREIE